MLVSGEETLHTVGPIRFGAFCCRPDDWRWREPNAIGAEAYVVLPKVPVQIEPDGGQAILATAAASLYYPPERRFRRTLVDPEGDRCLFFALADGLPSSEQSQAPLSAGAFALGLALERAAAGGHEPLFLDEAVCELVARLLEPGRLPLSDQRRRATARYHRELVEAAKSVLATRVCEALTLDQLGRQLAVSPFHLCRVFRAETGYTLHGFQTALRLRMALDRLESYRGDLARLAVDLGFTHHSHLTRSFKRAFGTTPSAWTPGTIVTARSPAHP